MPTRKAGTSVTLETADGRTAKVEKKRIERATILPIHLQWLREQDAEQYRYVRPLLVNLPDFSTATAESLVALHREYPSAPYAGIAAGVALSSELNEVDRATVVLRDTVARIERHRKLDALAHGTTLCCALNNLAVCLIKDGKANIAATKLASSVDFVEATPIEVYHNATLMQNVGEVTGFLDLSTNARNSMFLAVSKKAGDYKVEGLGKKFSYSIDWNLPTQNRVTAPIPRTGEAEQTDGKGRGVEGYVKRGSGTGFIVGDGWVMTNRHVVEDDIFEPEELRLTVSEHKSIETHLDVIDVIRAPEETGLDLALLKVDELSGTPLMLASDLPPVGREIIAVGFPEPGRYSEQMFVSRGIVSTNLMMYAKNRWIFTDATVNSGNSGGPTIDLDGTVVGISTAVVGHRVGNSRTAIVPSSLARDWAAGLLGHDALTGANAYANLSREELVAGVSGSVVLVTLWAPVGKAPGMRLTNADVDEVKFVFDDWCLACHGDGHIRCSNTKCKNGRFRYTVKVVAAVDPNTGFKSMRDEVVVEECGVCKGVGRLDCPQCVDGKF